MEFQDLTEQGIPDGFLGWYEDIKKAEEKFVSQLSAFQNSCSHEWEKVMEYDKDYSPRVDGIGVGGDVLIGWRCKLCKNFKPRPVGSPFKICHKCGGEMKFDHSEGIDAGIRAHIHKCVDCGHEYDTT